MTGMIDSILDIMRQLTEIYEEIHTASLQKREGIVENNVEKVSEAVKQEWTLLSKASSLEEQRAQIVETILGRSRKNGDEPGTLSDIEAFATEDQKAALEDVARKLRALASRQRELNQEIQGLVDLHLEYTNYMVNMVFQEPQVSTIYGTSGYAVEDDREMGGLHGIIDSQV